MVHNMVVKRVNIHDAKTNLSRYLAELTPGETLVLCNRNQPVAEVRSLRKKAVRKPRIGAAAGEVMNSVPPLRSGSSNQIRSVSAGVRPTRRR